MEREIKFRALKDDISNCGFVYGNLIYQEDTPRIQENNASALFSSCLKGTEGQYTGLLDKNGKEIYGGDILSGDSDPFEVKYGVIEHEENYGDIAEYMGFNILVRYGYVDLHKYEYEVIGNIHENPELK